MEFIGVLLAGVLIGVLMGKIIFRTRESGTLRVNTSDPDGPYLFLELNTDVHTVIKEKRVSFRVDSQK